MNKIDLIYYIQWCVEIEMLEKLSMNDFMIISDHNVADNNDGEKKNVAFENLFPLLM